ncbi:hypothetical protein I7I51_06631, partial [Histoplasma capsulatum]
KLVSHGVESKINLAFNSFAELRRTAGSITNRIIRP